MIPIPSGPLWTIPSALYTAYPWAKGTVFLKATYVDVEFTGDDQEANLAEYQAQYGGVRPYPDRCVLRFMYASVPVEEEVATAS